MPARRARSMLLSTVSPNKDPDLGRPWVDRIAGSSVHNLKELRVRSTSRQFRCLFVFDPRRTAIILLGGDKTGEWTGWYREAIPEAERLYTEHLDELTKEGKL
jgi:hypothetical protein